MHLITGGSGFIGSNIVARMSSRSRSIAICDTLGQGEKWQNLAKHNFEAFIQPDGLMEWLRTNATRLASVIHMGAVSATTEKNADLIISSNFILSQQLWEICSIHNIPFIYASSAATYGDGRDGFSDRLDLERLARLRPLNAYGWSKLAFDRYVLQSVTRNNLAPPKWAGIRFFNVYGPNEYHKGEMQSLVTRSYPLITTGQPLRLFKSYRPEFPDGGQMRDFVYVRDCVDVIDWMLENEFPSSIYNIRSGEARSWNELGEAIFDAANIAPRIEYIEMPVGLRHHYQYFTKADISKLRAAGYTARMTPLREGVADYVATFLASQERFN